MPKSREQKNVCQKGEETNQILSEKCPHVISTAPESFNAKIKLFRANQRGIADKKFFLFRIAKLYGYQH